MASSELVQVTPPTTVGNRRPGLLGPKRWQQMNFQGDTYSEAIATIERDDAETLRQLIGSSPHVGSDELGGWLVIASYLSEPATLELHAAIAAVRRRIAIRSRSKPKEGDPQADEQIECGTRMDLKGAD